MFSNTMVGTCLTSVNHSQHFVIELSASPAPFGPSGVCAAKVRDPFFVCTQVSRCAGLPWHHHRRAPAEYDDDDDGNRYKQQSARREPAERDYEERQEEAAAYDEPPEQNYEVDEAASVLSDGRVHGVQSTRGNGGGSGTSDGGGGGTRGGGGGGTDAPRKSGYVVDGKHYRKYRVEEETPDGFIVGEYGVVSHRDGTTRGVRYTADSSIDPRVVYEALAKFLSLRRRRRRRR